MPQVVPTASLAPGQCFISGDPNGPFIDTEKNVRGVGRIYLAIKHVAPFLRDAGWVPLDEVSEELDRLETLETSIQSYVDDAGRYRELVEAISPLLPEVEAEVREVAVFKDDKVRVQNEQLRVALAELKIELYDTKNALQDANEQLSQTAVPPAPESEGSAPVEPGGAASSEGEPAATVEVEDQTVDLDQLLDRSVPDVVAVAGSWPQEAKVVLLEREAFRRRREDKDARKTLIDGLFGDAPSDEEESS